MKVCSWLMAGVLHLGNIYGHIKMGEGLHLVCMLKWGFILMGKILFHFLNLSNALKSGEVSVHFPFWLIVGFEPWSSQTNDIKDYPCQFLACHSALLDRVMPI